MARLGDFIQKETHPLGEDGAVGLNMIGVSNERGLEISSRVTSDKLDRYIEIKRDWFAYNPMRINIGSIGLADDDNKTGYTSPDYTVFSCKDGLLPEFLLRFFKSDYGLEEISRHTSGAVRKRLYFSGLSEIELKIPSVEEQRKFVARFIHAEEAAKSILQEDSNKAETQLLKQLILQEAIMGNLTIGWRTQHPNVEPSSELLFRIQAEKALLNTAKKLRPGKPLPRITAAEIPFKIPKGWEWCRYGSLCEYVTSGSRGWQQYYAASGALFIRAQNIKTDKLCLDDEAFVDLPKKVEGTRAKVMRNDVLITITGGNLAKTALIEDDFEEAYVSQHIALTRLVDTRLAKWIHLALTTDAGPRGQLLAFSHGDKPGLNLPDIRNILIPLPPLTEQAAIVEQVEALMTTCRALEAEIEHSRSHATDLLQALFKEAFFLGPDGRSPNLKIENKEMMPLPSHTKGDKKAPMMRSPSYPLESFILRSFKMSSGYRSLNDPECEFHGENEPSGEAAPICLVGLNGSGKSNLIEAIADVFCFLELINLPWKSLRSTSSKYRKNDHKFEISYTIRDSLKTKTIIIRKTKKTGADFFEVSEDGEEIPIQDPDRLSVLPRRIIGYSSGLNETVSHTFLRTRTLYSEEVRDAAPPLGSSLSESQEVFDTRTLYMDYENNAEILLCNYIFRKSSDLEFIKRFTRVSGVASFELRFNRKIAGKQGKDAIARITDELESYLEKFARCAGQEYNSEQLKHHFTYELNSKTKKLFVKEFKTAESLFLAMYKWSLLNTLVLSDNQRTVFLKDDITKGTLERPPVVPPKSRLFDVADMKVTLSEPNITIDYSGLSDGEHQFVQVFGTVLLFNQPGTLFLFDEPESHFNPQWRTQFNSILNSTPNAATHEYVISTHSPYIVSGSRGKNVYKFERNGAGVSCGNIDFETYGASFDDLLKKLFSIDSMIDQSARRDLEEIVRRGNILEMQDAVDNFAESKEKRRLYEAIILKEGEE